MSLLDTDGYTNTRGLYVGAYLPEIFSEAILNLCDTLGLERPSIDDIHCTVMYSREGRIQHDNMPIVRQAINALVTSIQHWVGHNGKTYVVADVQSMALFQLHAKLSIAGARHSFSAYRPHITLGKVEKPSDDLEDRIEALNWSLKHKPIHVAFLGCRASDINED